MQANRSGVRLISPNEFLVPFHQSLTLPKPSVVWNGSIAGYILETRFLWVMLLPWLYEEHER